MIRTLTRGYRFAATAASTLAISLMLAPAAHASGSSMPWEQPLQQILQSIEGPVAKIIAVIIIIVTGLTLAFGDTSGGFRRLIQIVFGLSIAFAASSFFLSFFSFGGGALHRHHERHARRGRGPWPAPLACGPRHMGHRPFRGRMGGEARPALCRGGAAASAHPRKPCSVRAWP